MLKRAKTGISHVAPGKHDTSLRRSGHGEPALDTNRGGTQEELEALREINTMIGGSSIVAWGKLRATSSRFRLIAVIVLLADIVSRPDSPGGISIVISSARLYASKRLRAASAMERMRTLVASTPTAAAIASRTSAWTAGVNSAWLNGSAIFIFMTGNVSHITDVALHLSWQLPEYVSLSHAWQLGPVYPSVEQAVGSAG